MISIVTKFLAAALAISCVSACENAPPAAAPASERDPAISAAINDPIMVDPALTGQDRAKMAIAVNGPPSADLPPPDAGDEAVEAAKAEALKLAGGTLVRLPAPRKGPLALQFGRAATLGDVAVLARKGLTPCQVDLNYSANWATRMAPPAQVYPRGAVEVAAGSERRECGIALVRFTTPVGQGDVLDYYYSRLIRAGFSVDHQAALGNHLITAGKDKVLIQVHARQPDSGPLAVTLVATGSD